MVGRLCVTRDIRMQIPYPPPLLPFQILSLFLNNTQLPMRGQELYLFNFYFWVFRETLQPITRNKKNIFGLGSIGSLFLLSFIIAYYTFPPPSLLGVSSQGEPPPPPPSFRRSSSHRGE